MDCGTFTACRQVTQVEDGGTPPLSVSDEIKDGVVAMPYEKRDLISLPDEQLADPVEWPESWDQHRVQQEWRRRELKVLREAAQMQKDAARYTRNAALAASIAALISAGALVLDYLQDPVAVASQVEHLIR